MNEKEKNEKIIWEAWLDNSFDQSSNKLQVVRKAVSELYIKNKNTEGDLPYFTLHDPSHCESVENMLHKLIPQAYHEKLTIREKYYLLVSAWVHDIGMLPYVVGIIYNKEGPLDEYEIRKRHHETSEMFIVNYWYELKIDEVDKEVIGKLARYHRRSEDINECDEFFIVRNERIRLRLLASYLRLADALDISITRAPAEYYALCLAYNMSDDSKYHWIKSRLVVGVYPDIDAHIIRVTFKYPKEEYVYGSIDYKTAIEKLDIIQKIVIEDLREELMSVMNVIIKEGIAYYLDVEAVKSAVCYDERMLNDLREIVINYDIMYAPSDSKLLEYIYTALANLLGYSINKSELPLLFVKAKKEGDTEVKRKINRFLNVIDSRVLDDRPYPIGLKKAISEIRGLVAKLSINNSDEQGEEKSLINCIDRRYKRHLMSRRYVRQRSKEMFDKILSEDVRNDGIVNIVLYGFSEYATKCICGLRDSMMISKNSLRDDEIYDMRSSGVEKKTSERINIYMRVSTKNKNICWR